VCPALAAGTSPSPATDTCTACDAGLYLYKYLDPVSQAFTAICVPDCPAADFETVNDATRGQCLYLGPYCQTYSFASYTNNCALNEANNPNGAGTCDATAATAALRDAACTG
jgi:hypothetical protein